MMPLPVLLVAISPEGQSRLARERAPLLASLPETKIVLLTSAAATAMLDGAGEVWRDGDRRGASAFLARMRRLSWAGFGAVYDFDATFFTKIMRICLWPRPKWHVWPFLTCSNRASNL